MQARVFEGYFENGKFYDGTNQMVKIPEQYKVHITLFNERVSKKPTPVSPDKRPFSDLFGKWSGEIWTADDFDAPLDDMTEYMW
ncbi:MAG: DUF2281 domain-containing protein [Oscillospiraceae bacterium]|jgi:hypothetical protein|nr:DUF2281 domain-containing protein [Oscillospiraceae bacterium]